MNNKFVDYFTRMGLAVNGNFAYGVYDGYELNIEINPFNTSTPYKLHITFFADDIAKSNIVSALNNARIKFYRYQATPYGMLVGFGGMTNNGIIEKFATNITAILQTITQYGGRGAEFCPVCGAKFGTEKPAAMRAVQSADPFAETAATAGAATASSSTEIATPEKCTINGFTITLDSGCANSINDMINSENKAFAEAPNNILKGCLGALIGGVVGGILAVVLYFMGFIAAISAVVSVVLGAFLYQKLGGKPNVLMIVIVAAITIVFMALSIVVSYIIIGAEVGCSVSETFEIVLGDPELRAEFYQDIIMQLVFTVLGIIFEAGYILRRIKRQKSIK